MAFSVFMHGSKKLPILNSAISKLLATQFKNYQLVITPIIVKKFSSLNQGIENVKKNNNILINQHRMISHSAVWTAEKAVSVILLPLIPFCIYTGGSACDNILTVFTVLHMHWGIEAVVVDYVRPSLVGNAISQAAKVIVYLLSAFTLGGLLYFNYNDIGVTCAIKKLWAIKAPN